MILRDLTRRLTDRGTGEAPPGTTHVLAHVPSKLMGCGHPHPGGVWELWTARDYYLRSPACLPVRLCRRDPADEWSMFDGPAGMDQDDLRGIAEQVLRRPVMLVAFVEAFGIPPEFPVEWLTEPGYFITPAGGDR